MIRPECVTWGPETRLDTLVEGCVTDLLFAGDVLQDDGAYQLGEIIVKRLHRRSDATPEVGEKISLSWRSADAVLGPTLRLRRSARDQAELRQGWQDGHSHDQPP